jgi:hypothetical protein
MVLWALQLETFVFSLLFKLHTSKPTIHDRMKLCSNLLGNNWVFAIIEGNKDHIKLITIQEVFLQLEKVLNWITDCYCNPKSSLHYLVVILIIDSFEEVDIKSTSFFI